MYAIETDQIRTLNESDISSILARNLVGRIAFARGDKIDILPIQYVYRNGSIYGRTGAGGKLSDMDPNGSPVAFEVDEIRSNRSWSSVLAHGTFQVVGPDSGHEEWVRALGIVRWLNRSALRTDDPYPDRTQIFRIVIHETSGRALG